MGVLACGRRGCKEIMCNRYAPEFGYICDECFEELCNQGYDTSVLKFMDSCKPDLGLSIRVFSTIFGPRG